MPPVAGPTYWEEPKRIGPGRTGAPDRTALGAKLPRCGALFDLSVSARAVVVRKPVRELLTPAFIPPLVR